MKGIMVIFGSMEIWIKVILFLALAGVILYFINKLPIPPVFLTVINIIAAIIALVWALNVLGIVEHI